MALAVAGMRMTKTPEKIMVCRLRYFFTYDKTKLFDDKERAAETTFIQKWERERLEKLKKKNPNGFSFMERLRPKTQSPSGYFADQKVQKGM